MRKKLTHILALVLLFTGINVQAATTISLQGLFGNKTVLVIDGKHPGPILPGMTFLDRLSVEHKGNAMTLRQRK